MFDSLLFGGKGESEEHIGVEGMAVVKVVTRVDLVIVEEMVTTIGTARGVEGETEPICW